MAGAADGTGSIAGAVVALASPLKKSGLPFFVVASEAVSTFGAADVVDVVEDGAKLNAGAFAALFALALVVGAKVAVLVAEVEVEAGAAAEDPEGANEKGAPAAAEKSNLILPSCESSTGGRSSSRALNDATFVAAWWRRDVCVLDGRSDERWWAELGAMNGAGVGFVGVGKSLVAAVAVTVAVETRGGGEGDLGAVSGGDASRTGEGDLTAGRCFLVVEDVPRVDARVDFFFDADLGSGGGEAVASRLRMLRVVLLLRSSSSFALRSSSCTLSSSSC